MIGSYIYIYLLIYIVFFLVCTLFLVMIIFKFGRNVINTGVVFPTEGQNGDSTCSSWFGSITHVSKIQTSNGPRPQRTTPHPPKPQILCLSSTHTTESSLLEKNRR